MARPEYVSMSFPRDLWDRIQKLLGERPEIPERTPSRFIVTSAQKWCEAWEKHPRRETASEADGSHNGGGA